MMKKVNWEIYSGGNRTAVIDQIKSLINQHDGAIMNFNMFSDVSIALLIEMEEGKLTAFYNDLSRVATLEGNLPEGIRQNSFKEWSVFLNILFAQGTGELTIEVPKVPG